MEQKNNNALEKAEQISRNLQKQEQEIINEIEQNEQQKQEQKAIHQKQKATALREKQRRKELLRERRAQLRQEKKVQRQIQKNQTKQERERQIHLERQARRDQALENKQQRKNNSQKRKQKLGREAKAGWLAAVITLSVCTLVLASVLTFTLLVPTVNDNMLEATYQKSFYDTVEQIDNIDLNLSKALVTKDEGALQKYFVNTAINSELAENDIQQLPLEDQSKFYTTKLINQIGDFAKYLNNKLIDGKKLSQSDMESLMNLYKANRELKNSLQQTVGKMGQDYSFSSMIGGGQGNLVISDFNQLQNLSVQYPELIYDGPFSDGQTQREIKGLSGEDVTKEQAQEQFKKIFSAMGVNNVQFMGEVTGDIECYNVQGELNGDLLFAQISKKGGKLIMFSYAGECSETLISDDQAIENAQEFLSNLDIDNMKPVWINLANNVYTINFAGEQNDVIIYPDLIKIRVCAKTGSVIGLEAKSYYTNHFERYLGAPKMNKEKAGQSLSEKIEVDSVRLALVPIGLKTEVLCYEFFGTVDQDTYYIYIDATTGKQVEMFKVVKGTEGELLI